MTEPKDPFATLPNATIEEELLAIAKKIPALPTDYSELRKLLALLPDPIPSENPGAGAGDPGLFSVGAATPNQSSSTLVGAGPGTTPGASIGGVASPFVGQVNLVDDAPLDTASGYYLLPPKTLAVNISYDFDGWYEVDSGLNPQLYYSTVARTLDTNPFNSSQIRIGAVPIGACDASGVVFGPGPLGRALYAPQLAFTHVVGQVRVFRPSGNVYTSLSALTMSLELWREWRSGGARETRIDVQSVNVLEMADNAQVLLKAAGLSSNWNVGERAAIVVRLRVQASAAAASFAVAFAEPGLSMAYSTDAPTFAPLLSHYRPITDEPMAYIFFES